MRSANSTSSAMLSPRYLVGVNCRAMLFFQPGRHSTEEAFMFATQPSLVQILAQLI